jgi:hypothetical protein
MAILNQLNNDAEPKISQRTHNEDTDTIIMSSGNHRSNSYITQNYEKFKQQQDKRNKHYDPGKGLINIDSKRNSVFKESPNKSRESPVKFRGSTPHKDNFAKRFNDNINYVTVKNENVLQHRGSIGGSNPQTELFKHNIIPRIKDNNYINKFINK